MLKVYVQWAAHGEPFRLGSFNSAIWLDLKTVNGALQRAKRNNPAASRFRIEVLDPINIYRAPIRVLEFHNV